MALTQSHFRGGIEELLEATHGWKAAEDANFSQDVDLTFLLRFCVQADATGLTNVDNEFQYNRNSAGWVNITTASSIVKAVVSVAFTNGENCTKRLSGTGTFETTAAGCTEDGTSGGTANDIVASGNSETECALQIVGANVNNGDTIQFRLTRDGGVLLGTYAVTPTLTVVKSTPVTVTPGTATLILTRFTPVVSFTDNKTVTPGTTALTITLFTPAAIVGAVVVPGLATLVTTLFIPTVTVASGGTTVTPGMASLVLTAFAPTVSVSNNVLVIPGTATLTLTLLTPAAILGTVVVPSTTSLTLTAFAPTVSVSNNILVTPGAGTLVLTAFTPVVIASDNKLVIPGVANLPLMAYAPVVTASINVKVVPGTVSLTLTAYTVLLEILAVAIKGLYAVEEIRDLRRITDRGDRRGVTLLPDLRRIRNA